MQRIFSDKTVTNDQLIAPYVERVLTDITGVHATKFVRTSHARKLSLYEREQTVSEKLLYDVLQNSPNKLPNILMYKLGNVRLRSGSLLLSWINMSLSLDKHNH